MFLRMAEATHVKRPAAPLLGILFVACSVLPARAEVSVPYASERRAPVAPGVFHDQGTMFTTTSGRQAVHIVEIDRHQPVLSFEASLSNDRIVSLETTSSQANRKNVEGHRAVAGINGDFWDLATSSPSGMHIQNGELIADGAEARPTFGIEADGDVILGPGDVRGTASRPDGISFSIARVNQARSSGQLVVYSEKWGPATSTDNSGTEVVLTGVALPLTPRGTFSGNVSLVRPLAGNTAIGAGQIILSGSGAAAAFLNTLIAGDRVQFTFTITAGWENVRHAVGGGHDLVRSGVDASPNHPGFSDVIHPRSAVGITAGGDVVLAVVDGRQPGYSTGVTLPELAQLMISRGAVEAINLDGGGSSTMVVRLPGLDGVSVVNRPSDGFERSVTNSLLIFSSALTGPLAIANVVPAAATFFIGSHQNYLVRGQDAAYNAVSVDPASITWSTTGSVGSIDAAGRFSSSSTGNGAVVATIGSVVGRGSVSVVNTLASLAIAPNPAIVQPSATQQFSLSGTDSRGSAVIIDSNLGAWSLSGPIGTIDSSGRLTASSGGTGSVSAAVDSASATARVDVGRPPAILEDFEDISDMRALAARATSTLTPSARPNPVRSGTRAAKLSYSFLAGGTSAAYAVHSPLRPIEDRPLRIGVWMYGDASRHWVRGIYRDGVNAQRTLDFTPAPTPVPATREGCAQRSGGINWVGWKYLEAAIPATAVLPLKWERVYVVETVDLCDNTSAVYLDDLRAVYADTGEDLVGPVVSDLLPAPGTTVHTSRPEIGGTVLDGTSGSGVAGDSIRLTLDNVQVAATYEPSTGRVRFTPAANLADGTHSVKLEAVDNAGNPALPFGDWTFRIYTGPDLEAPVISNAQPLDGTNSTAGRPRVSARVVDRYRGVNLSGLVMTVDGVQVPATWNAEAGVVWWSPSTPLLNGPHAVTLHAADRETPPNVASATWTFSVNAVPQPSGAFTFTWIADGGYFEGTRENAATAILAEHLTRESAAPPALLVFGGDLVENDQQVNYDRAVAALNRVPSPRIVAAGNHEISGSLSRNRFWRTFGPTIAALDFGPVDFLIVDSASSRIDYDASQFAWLEQELARSDARTGFIVLHVPTRDPFASGHGLPPAEGRRLEDIFKAAKLARPARDLVVLSGDAHAFSQWMQDGVTYVISGGGGGGPDATPAAGGFYHRLNVAVNAAGVATIGVIPLFESAAVEPPAARLLGGDRLALSASGNVFTSTAPDMTIAIADPVARVWASSAPSVVAVHTLTGQIEAMIPGSANVIVTSGGVSAASAITVEATLASVRALTERAYAEGGITNDGIYTALLAHLMTVERGNRNGVRSYMDLLAAQRGKSVSEAWADRLGANAAYLIRGS